MRITEHFDTSEFIQKTRGSIPYAEYPTEWIEERLRPLCEQLEIIRKALGDMSIRVISGYRSPAYNKAIGGADKSQHMEGRAADIVVPGRQASEVHALILQLSKDKKIKIGGLGDYSNFVHVDIRPTKKLVQWSATRDES